MTIEPRPVSPEAATRQPVMPGDDRRAARRHDRRFSTVDQIALTAEQAATTVTDPTAVLAEVIKAAIASEADPYVLLGVLAEGTVQTLTMRVPDERRWFALQGFLQIIGNRTLARRSR